MCVCVCLFSIYNLIELQYRTVVSGVRPVTVKDPAWKRWRGLVSVQILLVTKAGNNKFTFF